ncbi:MAG TPA: DUF2019 domain-containing protein [Bradyrhizobium sp.]|nr:DUF2019 domain-containing protein [Bradyrhizobium sp.]
MKRIQLSNVTTKDLVERFAQIGVAQDRALLGGEITKFNRLFDQMATVSNELKSREGDQRSALMVLYDYPNIQVRLKAAKHTLAVAPVEARRQIEAIAASNWMPQAGDAGMSLWNLDRGVYKPT